MNLRHRIAAELGAGSANRLALPEYRQIELYTKRKNLNFAEMPPPDTVPVAAVAGCCRAFLALEAFLGGGEAPSWQTYLGLPRDTPVQKLTAELYRVLRVVRKVALHPQGHVEEEEGVIRLNGAINHVALSLELTAPGLHLMESAVAWLLDLPRQPYSDAYAALMLTQYVTDIVAEIKRFSDEDRVLYQYRQAIPFNRHYRFDCDNPRVRIDDGICHFEISPIHRDPARTPIDFYVVQDERLHIVPVEILRDGMLPLADFATWRIRSADGITLPASFRPRFARQVMVVGQPMT